MSLPSAPKGFFFRGQVVHLLLLSILLVGACLLVDFHQLEQRQLLGVSTQVWFVVSLMVPIVHQVYVWLAWRSELCYGTVTNRLGSRAFMLYKVVFMALVLARLYAGPIVYDRVLAANLFGTLTVLFIAVLGFLTGRPDFLDIGDWS